MTRPSPPDSEGLVGEALEEVAVTQEVIATSGYESDVDAEKLVLLIRRLIAELQTSQQEVALLGSACDKFRLQHSAEIAQAIERMDAAESALAAEREKVARLEGALDKYAGSQARAERLERFMIQLDSYGVHHTSKFVRDVVKRALDPRGDPRAALNPQEPSPPAKGMGDGG